MGEKGYLRCPGLQPGQQNQESDAQVPARNAVLYLLSLSESVVQSYLQITGYCLLNAVCCASLISSLQFRWSWLLLLSLFSR